MEPDELAIFVNWTQGPVSTPLHRMAVKVIVELMMTLFPGDTTKCITSFINKAQNDFKFIQTINVNLTNKLIEQEWSDSTMTVVLSTIRKLFKRAEIPETIVKRIAFVESTDKYKVENLLPPYFKKSPELEVVGNRILTHLKTHTKLKSAETLRCTLRWYANTMMPAIDFTLPDSFDPSKAPVKTQVQLKNMRLFCDVFGKPYPIDITVDNNSDRTNPKSLLSGDVNRLDGFELDKIAEVVRDKPLQWLIFITLLTTGIRVGGLHRIKLKDVTSPTCIASGMVPYLAGSTGKTLEKGNKYINFAISPVMKQAIEDWVINHRHPNSDWLFSSRTGGHMSYNSLRMAAMQVFKDAGFNGPKYHPHSLRHSYAYILLENGNDIAHISKLLGHSSVEITSNYYLKESVDEVLTRMNVPWLNKEDLTVVKTTPKFLESTSSIAKKKNANLLSVLRSMN